MKMNRKMKKILVLMTFIATAASLSACDTKKSGEAPVKKEDVMGTKQQPVPSKGNRVGGL